MAHEFFNGRHLFEQTWSQLRTALFTPRRECKGGEREDDDDSRVSAKWSMCLSAFGNVGKKKRKKKRKKNNVNALVARSHK